MACRRVLRAAAFTAVSVFGLSAQQAPESSTSTTFEAASIKPNKSGDGNAFVRRQPGGRFDAVNVPARFLITFAYQLQPFQLVGGPDWLGNDRFDILAKMDGDPPPTPPGAGPDPMMLAGRALLADRTGLTGNWDFELTFAPERPLGAPPPGVEPPPVDPNAPTLVTAVQEQLGLKLEPTKGPVDVWVIDRIEQPTPD